MEAKKVVGTNLNVAVEGTVGFGVKDCKGREIGLKYRVLEVDVVFMDRNERAAEEDWELNLSPDKVQEGGKVYLFYVQVTRDGEFYGATQSHKLAKSVGEAEEKIFRRVPGLIKKYKKQFTVEAR